MRRQYMKKTPVSIFDIDGTIFRSSLLIEITEALIQDRIFPANVKNIYARAYQNWLDRRGPYEDYIWAVVEVFEKNIKGVSRDKFLQIARKVVGFHRDRVYRYTRDLIKDLKKRGFYLLAISNSPKIILDEFCRQLGFDKVYGRVYAVDKRNCFTGETSFLELISDKAKILKRAIERENLTLQGSVGVGDTESDIQFLKLVAQPICFNPNQKLYSHAKRNGWQVVVERKDVIYELG